MAKIFGLNGVLNGRQGANVFVVRNGVNIVRKYQPVVANPSTAGQVETRAKLKLMSQLSALFGDGMGFRREGMVSPRNMFTKYNFRIANYDTTETKATIPMVNLKLTNSAIGFKVPEGYGRTASSFVPQLSSQDRDVDEVIYVAIEEKTDGTLRRIGVERVNTPGSEYRFAGSGFLVNGVSTVYLYAYGIRYNSESVRAYYSNLDTSSAAAFIEAIRSSSVTGVTMTETLAAIVEPLQ